MGARTLKLEVDEFRIGDYFPVRLSAGGQGALGAILFQTLIDKNTDWQFVHEMQLDGRTNAIVCIFVGKINGKPIKVAVAEPYRVAASTALIYNDPDFRHAAQAVVRLAADKAASSL